MKALIRVTGAVQGIGYRPFVAKLATEYKLEGEVKNLGGIVEIIVIGESGSINEFCERLKNDCPPGGIILDVLLKELGDNVEPDGLYDRSGSFDGKFVITKSGDDKEICDLPVFPPDIAICDKCRSELVDTSDRRYNYPLISCTSCGPRYSILKNLPYDRENITMDIFKMCPACSSEYKDGRRRHAQTISCHDCGPQVLFIKGDKKVSGNKAVVEAADDLSHGKIIAVKGIGGYQLAVSPYDDEAVKRLREIKGREGKPFAVMFKDIAEIRKLCVVSDTEEQYLLSSAKPIVLLDKIKKDINLGGISRQIGAFLPSTGLHVLLLESQSALIVTSANISGDPMIVSDSEFNDRFKDKVDGILIYNREIIRPLDDSVIQIVKGDGGKEIPRFIRRARGYVPLPLFIQNRLSDDTIYFSFGADLKNTFSIGYKDKIIMSQFFGDLDSLRTTKLQKKELENAIRIFKTKEVAQKNETTKTEIICDLHPGYVSTNLADEFYRHNDNFAGKNVFRVQHHHAHIGSVMAENDLKECIGVAFDGTGYGPDNTIWGSEFLICRYDEYERESGFMPITMVGQDNLVKDAAMQAACFLIEAGMNVPEEIMSSDKVTLLKAAITNNIGTHKNSGMGRIFDAVSCLLHLNSYNDYEGKCAVMLQNAAEEYADLCFPLEKRESYLSISSQNTEVLLDYGYISYEGRRVVDTTTIIKSVVEHLNKDGAQKTAYLFHATISQIVCETCIDIRKKSGLNAVALSGGVFTNRLLFNMCLSLLCKNDFMVYYNSAYPTNDGGISLGQIYLRGLSALKEKEG